MAATEKLSKRLDTDRTFTALGKYGRYQMQAFFSTHVVAIFTAMQVMQTAFTSAKPSFYCSKWNLVCSKSFYASFVGSLFMVGVMLGAGGITQLADLYGRRWMFIISVWGLFITGFIQAFVDRYELYAFVRFLTGVFYAGSGMTGWVICCENITTSMRTYLTTIISGLFWSVGYMMVGFFAYFVRNWRILSICLSVPALLSISFYWLVPETLHWYIAVGKEKEAEEWIRRAAKCNKKIVRIEECYTLSEKAAATAPPKSKKNIFHIFKSSVLLTQFLSMCYLWIINAFVYFGLSLFSTQLNGDPYVNFIFSGLVEIPSYFVAAYSMEKFGRRTTSVVFHLLAGISLLSLILVPAKTETGVNLIPLITALSLIGKFAISITFTDVFLYAAEIFPTTVRTVGIGWCSVAARIGAILAPYVGLMNDFNPIIVPGLCGSMALVASGVTFFIAESKGSELPEDMSDLRPSKLQTVLCPNLRTNNRQSLL